MQVSVMLLQNRSKIETDITESLRLHNTGTDYQSIQQQMKLGNFHSIPRLLIESKEYQNVSL